MLMIYFILRMDLGYYDEFVWCICLI